MILIETDFDHHLHSGAGHSLPHRAFSHRDTELRVGVVNMLQAHGAHILVIIINNGKMTIL